MAEHYCNQHLTEWFMRGNMRGYAHPIVDSSGESTGKWCNAPEQTETQAATDKAEPAPKPPQPPRDTDKTRILSFTTAWAKDLLVVEIQMGLVKEITLATMTQLCTRAQFLANFVNEEFIVETK